jgi:hypothetical protein
LLEGWNINTVPLNVSTSLATLNTIFQSYRVPAEFRKSINGEISAILLITPGRSKWRSGLRTVSRTSFTRDRKLLTIATTTGLFRRNLLQRNLEKGRAGLISPIARSPTRPTPCRSAKAEIHEQMEASSIIPGGWNVAGANLSDWTSCDVHDGRKPGNYLPGTGVRTTQVLPNDQVNVPNWTIGDRFNTKIEN